MLQGLETSRLPPARSSPGRERTPNSNFRWNRVDAFELHCAARVNNGEVKVDLCVRRLGETIVRAQETAGVQAQWWYLALRLRAGAPDCHQPR